MSDTTEFEMAELVLSLIKDGTDTWPDMIDCLNQDGHTDAMFIRDAIRVLLDEGLITRKLSTFNMEVYTAS